LVTSRGGGREIKVVTESLWEKGGDVAPRGLGYVNTERRVFWEAVESQKGVRRGVWGDLRKGWKRQQWWGKFRGKGTLVEEPPNNTLGISKEPKLKKDGNCNMQWFV